MEPKIHSGSLYDISCGHRCGVLVKESTMKKITKLQATYLEDVKRVLSSEAEKGNVFPSMWTLHYPDGDHRS